MDTTTQLTMQHTVDISLIVISKNEQSGNKPEPGR